MKNKIPEKFKKYLPKKSLKDFEKDGKIERLREIFGGSFRGMDYLNVHSTQIIFSGMRLNNKENLELLGVDPNDNLIRIPIFSKEKELLEQIEKDIKNLNGKTIDEVYRAKVIVYE